ncbi:MAG: hypothetical protein ABIP68_08440 [Ferruginibacter sp.]
MKSILSIQLKAAFLLIVFSLNTVIGFACAIGIDMGYNSKGHHDEYETKEAVHVHDNGMEHIHHEQEENHFTSHHHDEVNNLDNVSNESDNCCNDQVTKFEQLDKAIPKSSAVNPIFFTAFLSSFFNIDILVASQATKNTKYFVRGHHPPIPDILIANQRFQI